LEVDVKKAIIYGVVLSLFLVCLPAFSAEKGSIGASARAYEKASDEAIFHRVGDWFATRGKSEEESLAIIAERKAARAAKRAQKEAVKQKRKMKKEAKQAQKKIKGFGKK